MMPVDPILRELVLALPARLQEHVPGTKAYAELRQAARAEVERLFRAETEATHPFEPFGSIIFPYTQMGAIDSLDLFGLDELIIFSFYWVNRRRYRRVLDGGANIGLHSLVMARCGFQVIGYEPDPHHFQLLKRNLAANDCSAVEPRNAALSSTDGTLEFVRVVGNTTGSHLAGSKANPYGELQRFPVPVHATGPLLQWADLAKLDVEGHEKEIIVNTSREHWASTDAMMEVQSAENAGVLYDHFSKIGVSMYPQKIAWRKAHSIGDLPTSHREGSLFVTCRSEMPWARDEQDGGRP